MMKLLVLGVIFYFVYRFWDGLPKLSQESKENDEDEYADYEEVE